MSTWLALVVEDHPAHASVRSWAADAAEAELAMCRVAQMGLLRLLTQPAVMGERVVDRRAAWAVVDGLTGDDRVVWLDEPIGVESVWRALSGRPDHAHRLWTDDFLAATALAAGAAFATLDRRVVDRYPSLDVIVPGRAPRR